jgi:pyruvate,water dikinase
VTGPSCIHWFGDIGLADRPRVGGKGGSLGELLRAGVDVPAGFVVGTAAFEGFISHLESAAPLRPLIERLPADDLGAVRDLSARLRARVEGAQLPAWLTRDIEDAYARLGESSRGAVVAVRSSATTEDSAAASFAGLQDTFLWVTSAAEVQEKLRRCWGSLYSVESLTYRLRHRMPEAGVAMAVVIQRMVDARTAGVMFTRSPTTGDRSVITIEASWGLGSAVVSGEVTPDRWVVAKITGEVQRRDISAKTIEHVPAPGGGVLARPVESARQLEACLSDAQLQDLRSLGRKIERHYGQPQDIEWAIEHGTQRVLALQSRPETVWSGKDAAPVAQPAENPLHHLMSVFGGRR